MQLQRAKIFVIATVQSNIMGIMKQKSSLHRLGKQNSYRISITHNDPHSNKL